MLVSILIALLIFCVVVWVIGMLPIPASPFPIQALLYIIAAVFLIAYLAQFV